MQTDEKQQNQMRQTMEKKKSTEVQTKAAMETRGTKIKV